ncbi:MAG: nucleotide sugar dehydrogenase [Verrucomicrobiota bacterium]|jgi:UDPglucose 6-dehydrogenase
MKYSIIGLGKLGASMTAAIASRGFEVTGVDVNQRSVDRLNAGHAPVPETDLEETIAAHRERIRATCSHEEAILNSDITFVIVPTPSDERGAFSLQYAAWAFKEIGRALARKKSYHLVVLTSTVLPGSMRHGLLPILERESGKTCGPDFGLCYSPEFIALGSVIRDFLHPDFTLAGQFDERSGALLESAYQAIMPNHPPCKRMSLENAELAKISVNAFVTTKITFANMLADLCERIPGGDVDVVCEAVGTDRRIGARYLKGATGFGGPCFPRDNVALGFLARALGTTAGLSETTDQINRALAARTVKQLKRFIQRGTTVAVLGLAYKPQSHVIEESPAIEIAWQLFKAGARVVAYDPLAREAAQAEFRGQVLLLDRVADCLAQAEVVLVMTPDPEFAQLSAADFPRNGHPVVVVDFWRLLAHELRGQDGIHYFGVGCSANDEQNDARMAELWRTDWPAGRRPSRAAEDKALPRLAQNETAAVASR